MRYGVVWEQVLKGYQQRSNETCPGTFYTGHSSIRTPYLS